MNIRKTTQNIIKLIETVNLLENEFRYFCEQNNQPNNSFFLKRTAAIILELDFYITSASNLTHRQPETQKQLQTAKEYSGYLGFLLNQYAIENSDTNHDLVKPKKLLITINESLLILILETL